MAKRKNIKWTKELDARLIELRKANVKPSIISTIMDVPVTCIYNRSFALNLTKKGSGSLPIDLPVFLSAGQLEVARRVGITPEQYAEQVVLIDETEVPVDFMWRGVPTEWNAPNTKPKPTWWKQMMWWRN